MDVFKINDDDDDDDDSHQVVEWWTTQVDLSSVQHLPFFMFMQKLQTLFKSPSCMFKLAALHQFRIHLADLCSWHGVRSS